jgi:hypothetical protein
MERKHVEVHVDKYLVTRLLDGRVRMGLGTFRLIGSPCKGPITLPSLLKNSSHSLALAIASSNIISVKQLTHCCATAALLQNAVTTSVLVN